MNQLPIMCSLLSDKQAASENCAGISDHAISFWTRIFSNTDGVDISDGVLAETLGRSPRKLFGLYYLKEYFLDQSSQKKHFFILKRIALVDI